MRLQAICEKEIKRGKAPKYVEKSGTLVFAQKCNTKKGHINLSLAQYLDESTLHKYPVDLYTRYNDIIINSTGTGTLGRIGIFQESDDTMQLPIVPDSHITTVRAFSDNVAKYVYLFLKAYQCYFENAGEGSTNQKELRPEVIKAFLIAIPPYFEQNRIVKKFEKTCNFIDLLDTYTDDFSNTIKSIKLKILDLAVRGKLVPQDPSDEPASALLERIRAEKEELIKQGKIKRDKKESIIFKGEDNSYYENLPIGWETATLGMLSQTITKGTTPRGGNVAYTESGIGFLRAENIKGYDKLCLDNLKYVDEKTHFDFLKRSILQDGDILITIAGTLGRTAIVTSNELPLNTNQAIAIVRPVNVDLVDIKYIVYAINSNNVNKALLHQEVAMAIPNLSLENISDCKIPLPPLNEQKRIVSFVEELFKSIDVMGNYLTAESNKSK